MAALCNIALVTETWPPEINGVAMTLSRIVNGLRNNGHRVQVVRPRQWGAGETGQNGEQLLVPGAPIPGYGGLRFGLPVKRHLMRHWASQRPDVVHIATEGPLGWAALKAARRLGIPVTTSFHTQFHQYCRHYGLGWLRRSVSGYLRHFHNNALCTLVPNESLRDLLQTDGYRNVGVLGRGIDTELFNPQRRSAELRSAWGVDDDTLVALHVGRLAPEKNLKTVAAAFEALRAKHPNARMVWVGDGPQLGKLRRKHPDHIFAGAKTGAELGAHYASADVFLFASLTETFGNVTVEAMASGLALVAYRYAAAEQFLRHGISGLTAAVADSAEFCRLAARLGEDPDLARRLGKQATSDIVHLGWDHVLDQFTRTVEDAARQGQGSSA
ncbi:glycosyltransferase family 4 protein [Methylogaea oryzae]|uniref:Glycosyl transferase n=1 Tax=Methylogaea oryzae TaxID=1295382 RepID=A0A8D4VPR2_9GAMM|nr:glycosyltransferase family 1 protein [Methylogaea oryzae]BBL70414.1 glycosyl transferase [Methylogaea oryzae]